MSKAYLTKKGKKTVEREAVISIIVTLLDDVGPTMLDPFKQAFSLSARYVRDVQNFCLFGKE